MKNIDFLPAKYRELDEARRRAAWRVAVLLLFSAIVAASALFQSRMHRAVQQELIEAKAQLATAEAKHQQLGQLQNQLQAARDSAALITYLQHPWPRTQVLHEIVARLPDDVKLTEIRLRPEKDPAQLVQQASRGFQAPAGEQTQVPQQSAAQQDLKQLREESDVTIIVADISGATRAPAELHRYVAALGRSPLFSAVELGSLESLEKPDPSGLQARFSIRLQLRPGYGQPGGPQSPLASVTPSVARHMELQK